MNRFNTSAPNKATKINKTAPASQSKSMHLRNWRPPGAEKERKFKAKKLPSESWDASDFDTERANQ